MEGRVSRRSRLRRIGRTPASTMFLRVTAVLLVVVFTFTLAGVASASALVSTWLQDLPDYKSPTAFEVAQPTKIYSADGVLLAKLYLQNREVVPISEMATSVCEGIVAVEDERFYQHGGVDPLGIVRATVTTAKGNRQGASTITQQYIRNTVLLDERTKMTLERKIREAYLAIEVEKQLGKNQILENYLNTVYFGEGAYGVEAASETYFARTAKELTLPQAALIAGLVQAPSRLDPYVNPNGAVARRKEVLSRMLYNKYITQAQFDEAAATPLVLKRRKAPLDGVYYAPYFVAHVKKQLQKQFSAGTVFNGGLTVYTTLDTRLQKMADATAMRKFNGSKDPYVALVAIDPRNGYVKAMVGGRNFAKSKFNLATQAYRQPGSSFKTFVLVTALEQGMPPSFEIDSNSPVTIPSKPHAWTVSNSEGSGSGMMSLASATYASVNAVYARLAWALGIKNVARTATRMGITTPLPNVASIALGSVNCTPYEMASAYGTLATGGVHYPATVITKVVDRRGRSIFQVQPKGTQVLKPSVAAAATDVLQGVIGQGTGSRAGIGRPAAGKTGTSQLNRDAWFVGYTPQLVTAVWVGYPIERTIIVGGSKGFGGTLAAPIWASFMKQALVGQTARNFPGAPPPPYDTSKFDIPVSDETRFGRTVTVSVYSDRPRGTVLDKSTSGYVTTITISKGPKPNTPTKPTKPVKKPVKPKPSEPTSPTP
jgi:penicillin-binding protein 2D